MLALGQSSSAKTGSAVVSSELMFLKKKKKEKKEKCYFLQKTVGNLPSLYPFYRVLIVAQSWVLLSQGTTTAMSQDCYRG